MTCHDQRKSTSCIKEKQHLMRSLSLSSAFRLKALVEYRSQIRLAMPYSEIHSPKRKEVAAKSKKN